MDCLVWFIGVVDSVALLWIMDVVYCVTLVVWFVASVMVIASGLYSRLLWVGEWFASVRIDCLIC